MKKYIRFSVLILILCFWGCNNNSFSGKWVPKHNNITGFIDLKSDGTFYAETQDKIMVPSVAVKGQPEQFTLGPKEALSGKYSIDKEILTFTLPNGKAARGKINGNQLIDPEGVIWEREK